MKKVALQSFSKHNSPHHSELSFHSNSIEGKVNENNSDQNKKDSTIVELALNSEKTNLSITHNLSIKEAVAQSMMQYFTHLGDQNAANLYEMVINEVEPALLKAVLLHTRGNQSKASEALGLNRGTLRKKLQQHGIE